MGVTGVRAEMRGGELPQAFADGDGYGDFADGDDGFGAVVQRGHKRAGRAQHVEHDARGRAQIALGERGQFRRRQDGFNFHFASREGREGSKGNLQPI